MSFQKGYFRYEFFEVFNLFLFCFLRFGVAINFIFAKSLLPYLEWKKKVFQVIHYTAPCYYVLFMFVYNFKIIIKIAFVRLVFSRVEEFITCKAASRGEVDDMELLFFAVQGADEDIVPMEVAMSKVMFFKRVSYLLKLCSHEILRPAMKNKNLSKRILLHVRTLS